MFPNIIVHPLSEIRAFIMLSLFGVFVEYAFRAFRMFFSVFIRPISVFVIPRFDLHAKIISDVHTGRFTTQI